MAFAHSKNSKLIAGSLALTGFLRSWEHTTEREMADVTVHGDDGHEYVPGLQNSQLTLAGVWDTTAAAGGMDATLATARGAAAATVITAAPDDMDVGDRAIIASAREATYSVAAPVGDAVSWAATWPVDGVVDVGICLHALEAETADGNDTAVDQAASSANGGAATLHITAYSGLDSIVVAVQDSSDNETFADLIAFDSAAAVGAQHKTVTGTVNRYVQAEWDVTGTGSATFAVVFARR